MRNKCNVQLSYRFAGILVTLVTIVSCFNNCRGQQKEQLIRIVELEIDSVYLTRFNAALKEDIETAVKSEPGVLSLFAVYDKEKTTHVTIFEIYVNDAAHKSHQQTPHFLKYREATKGMVKSVMRREVTPITPGSMPTKN